MAEEPSQVLAPSIGAVSSLDSINIGSGHEPQNGQSQEHLSWNELLIPFQVNNK
jgi:hypothetical protein